MHGGGSLRHVWQKQSNKLISTVEQIKKKEDAVRDISPDSTHLRVTDT